MKEKTIRWEKVADTIAGLPFADNHIAVVHSHGKKICLGRLREQLFAFAWKCPHAGGILADGYIDALGHVVCPLHRYKFDLKNGRNTSGEGYYLKHWPVEVRADGIYIGMETGGSFRDLFG